MAKQKKKRDVSNILTLEHQEALDIKEEISPKLGRLTVPDDMAVCIGLTVQKLPNKVKEFVYKNCEFISIAMFGGKTIYAKSEFLQKRHWLIILCHQRINNEYTSVIAHEIAHAWLGHKHEERGVELEEAAPKEKEACLLVKQWGFKGIGAELEKHFKDALTTSAI